MQQRANTFGEAITVVDEPELVALGAALFAAQGARAAPVFSAAKHCHVVEPE
jgi:ribulose kinase